MKILLFSNNNCYDILSNIKNENSIIDCFGNNIISVMFVYKKELRDDYDLIIDFGNIYNDKTSPYIHAKNALQMLSMLSSTKNNKVVVFAQNYFIDEKEKNNHQQKKIYIESIYNSQIDKFERKQKEDETYNIIKLYNDAVDFYNQSIEKPNYKMRIR